MLVIDAEKANGRVLGAALRERGYGVRIATTASIGLQLASAVEPDVIILELGLPDLDGIEVCRRLRRWTPIPIIVLTVDGAEDRKVEALDAGADDYVVKPFSMPELLARVRVATRHRRALGYVSEAGLIDVGRAAHRRRRARSDRRRQAPRAHPQGVRVARDARAERRSRDPAPGAACRRVGRRERMA